MPLSHLRTELCTPLELSAGSGAGAGAEAEGKYTGKIFIIYKPHFDYSHFSRAFSAHTCIILGVNELVRSSHTLKTNDSVHARKVLGVAKSSFVFFCNSSNHDSLDSPLQLTILGNNYVYIIYTSKYICGK